MKDKKFLESKKAWYFILAALFGLVSLALGVYSGDNISEPLMLYMFLIATVGGGGSIAQGFVDRAKVINASASGNS